MAGPILHLRAETKPLEHRAALTPSTTKALLDAGFTVNVEHSPLSIFPAAEFEAVGAKLVATGSWQSAPIDHIIIGLKELPEESFPLKHTHIQFAHCYKNQGGWEQVLGRFVSGGGTLLDLEFLQDESGRRVAAFGYHAGYVGAALAVQTWAWQLSHPGGEALPAVSSYRNEGLLLEDIRTFMAEGKKISGRYPRVLVIGALGRCGRGAVELCQKVGIPDTAIIQWDMAETSAKSGPYKEIIASDIFINCIYLSTPIPPFVDATSLSTPDRNLSVICDVSCDTTNPHNPIPIYSINTTFSSPTVPVKLPSNPSNTPLSVISIDHLPSLLPREASEAFSAALLPSLMGLKDRSHGKAVRVWEQAEALFAKKVAELPKGTQSI